MRLARRSLDGLRRSLASGLAPSRTFARIHYIKQSRAAAPRPTSFRISPRRTTTRARATCGILDGVWDRIVDAAKGAALGIGTTMDFEITGVVWNILPNETLSAVMNKDLDRVGGFTYTPQELAFAEEIRKTPTESPDVAIGLQEKIRPSRPVAASSTDLADVRWNASPVSMTAAFVPGVAVHSWQASASADGTIGHKGMMVAAKSMAFDDRRSILMRRSFRRPKRSSIRSADQTSCTKRGSRIGIPHWITGNSQDLWRGSAYPGDKLDDAPPLD